MGTPISGKPLANAPLDGTEILPGRQGVNDVHMTSRQIADLATGGEGLPSQWSDGGHGNVTATVDDPTKTPFTVQSINGQSGPILVVTSVASFAVVTDNNNEMDYLGRQYLGYPTGDNGITVSAVNSGSNQSLSINETGSVLTIHLATDNLGNVTSTVLDVFTILAATSTLVNPAQLPQFAPTDPASTSGPLTLAGGLDPGQLVILPGGNIVVSSGNPAQPALQVVADQAHDDIQTNSIVTFECNGYGLQLDNHGTLIMINDGTNPSQQNYVNDGNDLGFEIGGQGEIMLPLCPTADPHNVGQMWSNGGVLTLSAG